MEKANEEFKRLVEKLICAQVTKCGLKEIGFTELMHARRVVHRISH